MSNRTRAFRRHHRMRMLNRARRKLYLWAFEPDDGTWAEDYILRNYDHLAVCSCEMCRNPRHCGWLSNAEKLTIQERKVYNVLSEELEYHYSSSTDD